MSRAISFGLWAQFLIFFAAAETQCTLTDATGTCQDPMTLLQSHVQVGKSVADGIDSSQINETDLIDDLARSAAKMACMWKDFPQGVFAGCQASCLGMSTWLVAMPFPGFIVNTIAYPSCFSIGCGIATKFVAEMDCRPFGGRAFLEEQDLQSLEAEYAQAGTTDLTKVADDANAIADGSNEAESDEEVADGDDATADGSNEVDSDDEVVDGDDAGVDVSQEGGSDAEVDQEGRRRRKSWWRRRRKSSWWRRRRKKSSSLRRRRRKSSNRMRRRRRRRRKAAPSPRRRKVGSPRRSAPTKAKLEKDSTTFFHDVKNAICSNQGHHSFCKKIQATFHLSGSKMKSCQRGIENIWSPFRRLCR